MESVGDRVKQVRKEERLTQAKFADDMAISQAHVSKIEKGVEHPSPTLLRLISLKYAINEEWLIDGSGNPRESWGVLETDEDVIIKYNTVRGWFEGKLQKRTSEDLLNTVEAFNYLDCILSLQHLSSDGDKSKFLSYVCNALDEYEKAVFHVSSGVFPSKNDVQSWIEFRTECEKKLQIVSDNIKASLNIYLSLHGDEKKI